MDDKESSASCSEWRKHLSLRSSTYAIPVYLQIGRCLRRGFQRLRNQPAPVTTRGSGCQCNTRSRCRERVLRSS
ncbi:hypothetical protein F4778DRAFT_367790 [Xylariomycetidae sp. FL2044]|nr:hypothetical protein F4778DRAFT_367790 [Xylariomycetidae sp. FL2044]